MVLSIINMHIMSNCTKIYPFISTFDVHYEKGPTPARISTDMGTLIVSSMVTGYL